MKEDRLKSQVTKMKESKWCIDKLSYLKKCTQLNPMENRLLPLLEKTDLSTTEMKDFLEYAKTIKDEEDAITRRKDTTKKILEQDRIQQIEITKRENHAKILGWRVFEYLLISESSIRDQFYAHVNTTQFLNENEKIILKEYIKSNKLLQGTDH
jgi:hypothetical protein